MSDLAPETDTLVQRITAAVSDLNWPSETDAPFDVMVWPVLSTSKLSAQQVLEQAHLAPDTSVAAIDLDTFFEPTQPQSWHSAEEQAISQKFQSLQSLLHQTLENIQVFRCGEIEIEIYIVGRNAQGDWIVLHTTAVET